MKYLFLAAGLLLATSCTRPPVSQPPQSEPIGADALTPDSTLATRHVQVDSVVVARQPSLLDKMLHRTPKPYTVPVAHAQRAINIGKRSNVSVYYGTANVNNNTVGKNGQLAAGDGAVASHIEKKAGPAIVASDSSTQNALLGGGNLAAVHGDGNQLGQTKADVEPPGVGATIAKAIAGPAGLILGVGLGVGAIYLIVLWRKKKTAENLV